MAFLDFLDPSASNIPLPQFVNPMQAGVKIPGVTSTAPVGTTAAASGALGGIGGLGQYNVFGQLLPQAQGIGQGMVNDPSAFAYLQAAQTGAGLGTAGAFNQFGAGANLYGLGGPTIATGFDPQQSLYTRTLQQLQDQTGANLAQSGLLNTPWGQGVLGNTLSNFNIDWQNTQQGRQLAALNALSQMYPTAAGLQSGAAGQMAQAGGLPWGVGQTIGGTNLGTLGSLGQFGASAANLPQSQIQNYLNYLGWATPAEQQAFQQQQTTQFLDPMQRMQQYNQQLQQTFSDRMQQDQQAFQEQQAIMKGLGGIAGGLGGFALGGPMGAMIGSSLFGGGSMPNFGTGAAGSGYNIPSNFYQPFGGLFSRFQWGGRPETGQPAMVGEAGPELFIPDRPGTIIPNHAMPWGGGNPGGGAPGIPWGGGNLGMHGGGLPMPAQQHSAGDLPAAPYPMPGVQAPYEPLGGIGGMGDNFGFRRDHGRGWSMPMG